MLYRTLAPEVNGLVGHRGVDVVVVVVKGGGLNFVCKVCFFIRLCSR